MTETYYDILGVSSDASTAEIETAYRERLKETHPDVSDDDEASERTKTLIEAKEVLTDDDERARYDRLGHAQYVGDDGPESEPTAAHSESSASTTQSESSAASTRRESASTETDPNQSRAASGTGVGGGRAASAAAAERKRRQQRNDQQAPRDSWNSDRGRSDEKTWRAWDTEGTYTVNDGETAGLVSQLLQSEQSLVVLAATVVSYPMLLWAALYPPFPLTVNATVALCLLVLVAYLQSIPAIGVVVYGSWSVLLPVGAIATGLDITSLLVGVALLVTILSFGFTLLTRAVVGN